MRYVSSLISGVGIFFFGAGLAWYHGFMGLMHPEAVASLYWPFIILGGSLLSEGGTLFVAFKEIRNGARKERVPMMDYSECILYPFGVSCRLYVCQFGFVPSRHDNLLLSFHFAFAFSSHPQSRSVGECGSTRRYRRSARSLDRRHLHGFDTLLREPNFRRRRIASDRRHLSLCRVLHRLHEYNRSGREVRFRVQPQNFDQALSIILLNCQGGRSTPPAVIYTPSPAQVHSIRPSSANKSGARERRDDQSHLRRQGHRHGKSNRSLQSRGRF